MGRTYAEIIRGEIENLGWTCAETKRSYGLRMESFVVTAKKDGRTYVGEGTSLMSAYIKLAAMVSDGGKTDG